MKLSSPSKFYQILAGLSPIAALYEGYLLDVWGLLHDGINPFPEVINCLETLKALGKKTLLLSNSPRRGSLVSVELAKMGISPSLYGGILTSGDATYLDLMDQRDHMGRNCYFIGHGMHKGLLDDLQLNPVDSLETADFILNTGPEDLELTLEDFKKQFRPAIERGVLMICANPDMKVMIGSNQNLCAGTLAQVYEDQGGRVHYHGKPFPAIYDLALKRLGILDAPKVLALGDSLQTDIKGAQSKGIDGALVASGIHGYELNLPFGALLMPKDVDALTLEYGLTASYYLPSLRW